METFATIEMIFGDLQCVLDHRTVGHKVRAD
jgi:hypothetical protein